MAQVQAARDLEEINQAKQIYKEDQLKAFEDQLADLETEIAIEEAITDELKDQLRLEQEIRKLKGDKDLTDNQKAELEERLRRLKEARDGNQGVSGYMKQLQSELMDTEGMIVSLAQTVETEFASAMSTALIGLLDGTAKAEEAFANMFKNIGKAFIDMAMQMIAKLLILKALQMITGIRFAPSPVGSQGNPFGNVPGGSMPGGPAAGGGRIPLNFSGGGYTGDAPRSGGPGRARRFHGHAAPAGDRC